MPSQGKDAWSHSRAAREQPLVVSELLLHPGGSFTATVLQKADVKGSEMIVCMDGVEGKVLQRLLLNPMHSKKTIGIKVN